MRSTGEVNTGEWEPINDAPLVRPSTWVSAEKRSNPVAYPMGEYSGTLTDSHLTALETIKETSTPVSRAVGLAIRTVPFAVLWLALSAGLFFLLGDEPVIPFLLFCVMTAITYYLLNGQEYRHSASGLERHKADLAHDLQARRIDNDHELRSKALDSYIRHLEGER